MSKKLQEDAELVSALVDGQLQGNEFGRVVDHLAAQVSAREAWDTYHLVGEVIRSGAAQLRTHDPLFVDRLHQKIASNASELIAVDDLLIMADSKNTTSTQSANDTWWRSVAGLLSMALVGVLAWQGYQFLGELGPSGPAPQMAQLPSGSVALRVSPDRSIATDGLMVNSAEPMMIRDLRLDALLAAHRQFGGTSALQTPSGFLRNATFDEGNR